MNVSTLLSIVSAIILHPGFGILYDLIYICKLDPLYSSFTMLLERPDEISASLSILHLRTRDGDWTGVFLLLINAFQPPSRCC